MPSPPRSPLRDPAEFGRAYARHSASVYGAAYSVLRDSGQAEDVVQDVFLRLWRDPERFDASRGELGSFLRLMARSRALDSWRSSRSASQARERLVARAEREAPDDSQPAAEAERAHARAAIRPAVRALPEEQRKAIFLAFWGELSSSEIAARADLPLGTVKSRIRLALAKLREPDAEAERRTA